MLIPPNLLNKINNIYFLKTTKRKRISFLILLIHFFMLFSSSIYGIYNAFYMYNFYFLLSLLFYNYIVLICLFFRIHKITEKNFLFRYFYNLNNFLKK